MEGTKPCKAYIKRNFFHKILIKLRVRKPKILTCLRKKILVLVLIIAVIPIMKIAFEILIKQLEILEGGIYEHQTDYVSAIFTETASIFQNTNFTNTKKSLLRLTQKKTIRRDNNYKYVLLWNRPYIQPFSKIEPGSEIFETMGCPVKACYVSNTRDLFGKDTKFDAIIFTSDLLSDVKVIPNFNFIRQRNQKLVFFSKHALPNMLFEYDVLNNFFNWTWTYKLDSDFVFHVILVKDLNDNLVAPSTNPKWMLLENMSRKTPQFEESLLAKSLPAAVFLKNCELAKSSVVGVFAKKLKGYFDENSMSFDLFSDCNSKEFITRDIEDSSIINNYFFIMVFETYITTDYISPLIFKVYNNHAIPVVYGGANYSRFLPPGSYINAYELGAEKTVLAIRQALENQTILYEYFRWTNYYKITDPKKEKSTDSICKFCEALHDENKMLNKSVYLNFTGWWLGDHNQKILDDQRQQSEV